MSIKMSEMKVKITLLEEMLGTSPSNQNIHEDYVASKAPDAASMREEIEAIGVDAAVEKAMTIFPREEGEPFVWDYQIRGFVKEAIGALKKVKGTTASGIKAHKKLVDNEIFVEPRKIEIRLSGAEGKCERPLRASTPMGERVALANSETVPAGSSMVFTFKTLNESNLDAIREALDYGELKGLGQWRNSGKGRFIWEEIQ